MYGTGVLKRVVKRETGRGLNREERDRQHELEDAGFKATPIWDGMEWCFETVTPNGADIGPMTVNEVFWMMRGYKAGIKR